MGVYYDVQWRMVLTWFKVQMLGNLLIEVESEAQIVDLGRVSGFMQKIGQM